MSSALSTAARDDVDILYDRLPAKDDASSTLWELLRATCFDAYQGAQEPKSLVDLAQSSICFGNISKLVEPLQPNQHATTSAAVEPSPSDRRSVLPPRLVKRPWGNVLRSWAAPTALEPFASIPSPSAQTGIPAEDDQHDQATGDVRQRPLAPGPRSTPELPGKPLPAIGAPLARSLPLHGSDAPHMYSPVKLKAGKWTGHCGAYLLEDTLLFIYKDVSGSLHIHRQINLTDVHHIADRSVSNSHVIGIRTVFGFFPHQRTADRSDDGAEYVYTNYNFSVESAQLVGDWLSSLKSQLLALNPNHPISPRPAPKPRPPKPRKGADSSTQLPEPLSNDWSPAGAVFLSPSLAHAGEYNLGVSILPQFSSDGLATHAIADVLERAFGQLRTHRVQARVICTDTDDASRAICKFVHLGFTHEGILRRAFMHPVSNCWMDVSVLSILDVDWAVRLSVRPPPQSIWDEMFGRHQRERERILAWGAGLKRTKSMETIRDLRALADSTSADSVLGEGDGSTSSASSVSLHTESGASTTTTSWDAVSAASGVAPDDERLERWADERAVLSGDTEDELGFSWDDGDDSEDGYSDDDEEGNSA